ncbi:hypothetical protein LKL35_01900 [Streptomyces sp. ET3-23]|uniref:hypothetical protein n=1 Tax=Streptomyces sp. ET3-23 TaxID=2885643 RepID=UPI001D11EFD0|nr:hypothetical protein [Streptomyces sp. ET3-23]MCC2274194.1 hypothetical protein [Streptomyces sp. ET3-23]
MARQQPRKTSREPKGPGARSSRESQGGTARDQALEGVRARGGRAEKDKEKERTRGEAHGKRTRS